MVDIHSHILPSLDDGSRSLEESLRMASQAVSSGIRHMAATSHGNFYDYTLEDYWTVFRKTQEAFTTEHIPLKLYPGMEIFLDEDAFFLLEKKELLSLNNTDYLLVEFDFEEQPGKAADRIGRLREKAGGSCWHIRNVISLSNGSRSWHMIWLIWAVSSR